MKFGKPGTSPIPHAGWVQATLGRVSVVWAIRSWTVGLGFPTNMLVVVFLGPLILWIGHARPWPKPQGITKPEGT